jgi:polysaccharide pyruvyl transferase WcaK-like protein
MTEPVRIGIITRLSNTNAGNEALSTELIELAKRMSPCARVMAINRYPRFFEHLKLSSLGTSGKSPTQQFDALAAQLGKRFSKAALPLPPVADGSSVLLDTSARELRPALRKIKNFIGVRRNLARFGLIDQEEAFSTVSFCRQVDLLLWNPAGEFHPTGNPDQTFRLLLLVRIAQLSGVATCIINHSLEIDHPLLREIVGHAYREASHISVRDAQSVSVALSLGVEANKLSEAPDLAFLAARKPPVPVAGLDRVPEGAIGFAINAAEAFNGPDEWDLLLNKLKVFGRPLVFVSNAMNGDWEFGKRLMSKHGGITLSGQPSYLELRALYQKMSVLISSRLHASILSLCGGNPVVTVEPSVFKLSAILKQLQYPIATDVLTRGGWADRIFASVEYCLAERATLVKFAQSALSRQIETIHRVYEPIFQLATDHRLNTAGSSNLGPVALQPV